ncbi:MAG: aspartate aminotransferase family protein [Syntrophomonadaceae bacterium]|nr:aspartate aminotransferase family protein [Syntrophomonadaceae bacterium]
MSNKSIMDKGRQYIMNTYGRIPIALVKGEGSRVWDADGKEYLDLVGGIAVCALGHAHPELTAVLRDQSEKLWHCSNLYWIEPQVELAAKLCQSTGMDKAFFANSGAEANEGAIKLARKYFYRQGQNRYQIIACRNSFHGRTTGALAATGQTKYQQGFEPLLPGIEFAEFNNLESVKALLTDKTCGILVEPIQGEGGVNPATVEFMTGLKRICQETGALLMLDEVQCGVGRTGDMMAFQYYGITPDIVTLAKGLGGGFPIGALLATDEAASGFGPGDHASTFGGNPLGCAVAHRVVEIISEPDFLAQVKNISDYMQEKLEQIVLKNNRASGLRGRGLLLGIEFSAEVKDLVDICRGNGLLLLSAGPRVLRFVPPLNITESEVDEALNRLEQSLQDWK